MLCENLSLIVNLLASLKKKVLRPICLNVVLIRCNLFSCIFIHHVKLLRMACWIGRYINALLLLSNASPLSYQALFTQDHQFVM